MCVVVTAPTTGRSTIPVNSPLPSRFRRRVPVAVSRYPVTTTPAFTATAVLTLALAVVAAQLAVVVLLVRRRLARAG